MKGFGEFLNENWTEDFAEAGRKNALALGIKEPKWLYEDNVRNYWLYIIEQENHISEKDFNNYNRIKEYLNNFIDEHNDTYKTIVMEFENKKSRYQFCAEHLHAIYPLQLDDIIQ